VASRYYGKAEELFTNIGGLFETIRATGLQAAGWCIQVERAGLLRSGSRVLGFEVAVACAAPGLELSERAPLWNEMMRLFSPTISAYLYVLKDSANKKKSNPKVAPEIRYARLFAGRRPRIREGCTVVGKPAVYAHRTRVVEPREKQQFLQVVSEAIRHHDPRSFRADSLLDSHIAKIVRSETRKEQCLHLFSAK
jgi:hypothetical protein